MQELCTKQLNCSVFLDITLTDTIWTQNEIPLNTCFDQLKIQIWLIRDYKTSHKHVRVFSSRIVKLFFAKPNISIAKTRKYAVREMSR